MGAAIKAGLGLILLVLVIGIFRGVASNVSDLQSLLLQNNPTSSRESNITKVFAASATYLDAPLSTGDILRAFNIPSSQLIDGTVMSNFLKNIGVNNFDANQTAYVFSNKWDTDSTTPGLQPNSSFIPDPTRLTQLEAVGINPASTSQGMTPQQYLTYLSVGFGDGSTTSATVKDFMISLITNLNPIYNIRTTSTTDQKYLNRLSLHRESIADRQVFDYLGKTFYYHDYVGFINHDHADPLRKLVITSTSYGPLLVQYFDNTSDFKQNLINTTGVDPAVAAAAMNQFYGITEMINSHKYYYGAAAFLSGKTEDRTNPGHFYTSDLPTYNTVAATSSGVWKKLDPTVADSNKQNLTYQDIYALVNATGSFPFFNTADAQKSHQPPWVDLSPTLTGDELLEFYIALGNALPNYPNDKYSDLIPTFDLNSMSADNIYNAEFEYMRKVIPNVYSMLGVGPGL